jgi:hypothetical protein
MNIPAFCPNHLNRIAQLSTALLIAFRLTAIGAPADSQQLYLEALLDFERHAETIWHDATGPNRPADSGFFGDGLSQGNGGIRGSCGVAIAYAVLARALPQDPKRTNRLMRVRKALNYAANTHVTGANTCVDGRHWGWNRDDWQTALWAASLGLACVLVQDELPPSTVRGCRRVVASEATHRAAIPPASGYHGDTKAEENAWDSNILALAAAWLNSDPRAPLWLDAAKKYLANSYTVANPSGDPLASWITTVTLYPSFALENHGFYHPTYEMVAGMSLGDSLLMARLANAPVAAQLRPFAEHNVLTVWTNNLEAMLMDSGEFAYPSGLDWELHDFEQNSYLAWLATHFNDPLARWADHRIAQLVRYRQRVNGDGRFVGESVNRGFFREAVEARRTAIAWLRWANDSFPAGPAHPPPAPEIRCFPDVQIITHRAAFGFFGLSFGSRIMAFIEPSAASVPTNAFVATPRRPGIIGLGALGPPTRARLVRFTPNPAGFDAELYLQNSTNGATQVYVKSTDASVAIVEVPSPAHTASRAATMGSFCVGIENDPLTGSSRSLEWSDGETVVPARSGAVQILSNDWICVAGRYGLAAGPAGYFRYQAASDYNRSGAAEDTLQFFPRTPLAPRYAVWFPGRNASETMSRARNVHWSVSGTNAVLAFPGPGGAPQQLHAVVPARP